VACAGAILGDNIGFEVGAGLSLQEMVRVNGSLAERMVKIRKDHDKLKL
jgi:hypothetical protein